MEAINRRQFLRVAGGGGAAAAAAACAPGVPAPEPTGSDTTAREGWEKEWQEVIKGAKKEGKLVINTSVGAGRRKVVEAFEQGFPEIQVEHQTMKASDFVPRARAELQAGVFIWDVIISTYGSIPLVLVPMGGLDPVKNVIFRPDVLDDKAWIGSFAAGWLDKEKQYAFGSSLVLNHHVWINTDMVKEDEIKSVLDLLNPKWKGRMLSADPRIHGGGWWPGTIMRMKHGDDIVRRLWKDQQVTVNRDDKQMTDAMVKGQYAISIGTPRNEFMPEYRARGLGLNLKKLNLPDADHLSHASEVVYLYKNAAHPNAAKLFINWFLTREAQAMSAKETPTNSRRSDVEPGDPLGVPPPDAYEKYIVIDKEELAPEWDKTKELAKEALA